MIEKLVNLFAKVNAKIRTKFIYSFIFNRIGRNTIIYKPLLISNGKYINLGNKVLIRNNIRLETIPLFGKPLLSIGDNCNIEQNVHIICSNKVVIGKNCTITANCAIVDTTHPYEDITLEKIGNKLNHVPQEIIIGDNCFLGIGAILLPNVKLEEYCIVGANSVVTKSFPAYSVIAGNPAIMIKRYDLEKKIWRKTNNEGEFIDEI